MMRPDIPQPTGNLGTWAAQLFQALSLWFGAQLDGPWVCKERFSTERGRRVAVTTVTSATYDVAKADHVINVNRAGAVTLDLPAAPDTGQVLDIGDSSGAASSNNITIDGNGKNINGASTLVISANYGRKRLHYGGTQWLAA